MPRGRAAGGSTVACPRRPRRGRRQRTRQGAL